MEPIKTIIMGAGGRDFHNFNTAFRSDPLHRVVAFTATQIPGIDERVYPPSLAGPLYPDGIPIIPEDDLERVAAEHAVREVVFAYSDVSHAYLADVSARVNALGADFRLLGPDRTMIDVPVPAIAVVAARTGCGKSQTTRYVSRVLRDHGKRVVVVRHPMPYGDLDRQRVQRFATLEDMDKHRCTIEEREEYEPHIQIGNIVYAGVDYGAIFEQAAGECDLILWDGGNNDFAFLRPDLTITVVDPHRPGHELTYYPGAVNTRLADVIVVNKVDSAEADGIATVRGNVARVNPRATIVEAESPLQISDAGAIRGKRALVIEDGPTLTHGGMRYGAGVVAARRHGVGEIIDPRPHVVGRIKDAFEKYPDLGPVLPALGYGEEQIADLQRSVDAIDCDVVVIATPIDLGRLVTFRKPAVRVTYDLKERDGEKLRQAVE
ncbi:MAG: cyclic 2,3-diphosphoglycerate synthase, partial [Candidatus Eiseniibacteriota bacterium]